MPKYKVELTACRFVVVDMDEEDNEIDEYCEPLWENDD